MRGAIVYQDDDLLVVHKPSGQVVHPAHANPTGTLWDDLRAYFACMGITGQPGLVHRLDKDTSGLLVVAKTSAAHRHLHRQFARRQVVKGYLAVVDGQPPQGAGVIALPLARDPYDRRRVRVALTLAGQPPGGQEALTAYRVLRRWPGHTLLRLWPHTGRTHQLRVHLAHIGAPICGDPLYNPRPLEAPRLMLHADTLGLTLPGGARVLFRIGLPPDIKAFTRRLA